MNQPSNQQPSLIEIVRLAGRLITPEVHPGLARLIAEALDQKEGQQQ